MLKKGDTIKYIRDVYQPPHQAGKIGDEKIVDQDISLYHARFLLRGPDPYVEKVTSGSQKPEARRQKKVPQPETNNE